MALPVIAIFDIGKTNKKFFLFDEDYHIVSEVSTNCLEVADEDGFPCDDIFSMTAWIKENLYSKLADQTFDIKAINFSTYGASFVHIDKEGIPLTPLYNYLKPFPDELDKKFYESYGSRQKMALQTASPALGMLNSGLQLYWLKYYREQVFQKIHTSLHLPQYLAYLFHEKLLADITSIGCHTALWHFEKKAYHDWVSAEGIDKKLAPLFSSEKAVAATVNNKHLQIGVGLHDSSAAFIPYIQGISEPFLLISTGTWCISMNPYNNAPLTPDELEKDCLCYMTYKGTPVKASRLFAGYEHEQETKKMAGFFNVDAKYFAGLQYDSSLPASLDFKTESAEVFNCEDYTSYEAAYHQLIAMLVKQQKRSTDLVLHNGPVKKIFVDGGFAKNEIYMNLLAKAYPGLEVNAASVSQASALGAALAIHEEWNTKPLPQSLVEVKRF